MKKNVSIRYQDPALFEKLIQAAAKAQIFDLVKVDYVVKDIGAVQDKLMEEAAHIAKHKMSRYEKLLGIKLQAPVQIYSEKAAVHFPTFNYDSYTAFEAEEVRVREVRSASTRCGVCAVEIVVVEGVSVRTVGTTGGTEASVATSPTVVLASVAR